MGPVVIYGIGTRRRKTSMRNLTLETFQKQAGLLSVPLKWFFVLPVAYILQKARFNKRKKHKPSQLAFPV